MPSTGLLTLTDTPLGRPPQVFTFWVNPSSFTVTSSSNLIENKFLRSNRGIVKSSGVSNREITGEGFFVDDIIADNQPINERDKFALIKKFEQFQLTNRALLFAHSQYGSFNIVIRSIQFKESPTSNALNVSFSFVETLLERNTTFFITPENNSNGNAENAAPQVDGNLSTKNYTVQGGDTLWSISQKFYGNALNYPVIYKQNLNVIEDAAKKHGKVSSGGGHWIFAGTTLVIPNSPTNQIISNLPSSSTSISDASKGQQEQLGEGTMKQLIIQLSKPFSELNLSPQDLANLQIGNNINQFGTINSITLQGALTNAIKRIPTSIPNTQRIQIINALRFNIINLKK